MYKQDWALNLLRSPAQNPWHYEYSPEMVEMIGWYAIKQKPIQSKYFWFIFWRYGSFRTCKAEVPELDYIEGSSAWLSNDIRIEAMYNVSAHLLPWYYQQNWVGFMVRTISVI